MVNTCGPVGTLTSENVSVGVGSQLSVAVAVPVAGGFIWAEHSIVKSGGHVIAGGTLSFMKINCTQVLELPQLSVALHVREMILSWGQAPPAVASVNVMAGVTSHISVAVALPVFAGAVLAVQETDTFAGQVITGGVLSVSTIICIHILVLPLSSVAFQVRVMMYPNAQSCVAVVTSE